jgi:hypothetical protein
VRADFFVEASALVDQRYRSRGAIEQPDAQARLQPADRRLTPESVIPISSAALTNLPPSTTAANTLTTDKIRPSKGMTSTPDFQSGRI